MTRLKALPRTINMADMPEKLVQKMQMSNHVVFNHIARARKVCTRVACV